MSINPAKFDQRFKNLSAICQKVFGAVSDEEVRTTNRIHAELQHQGVSRDLNNTKGCLNSLVHAGLVIEPMRGSFARVAVRAKPAKQEQPAPSAPLAQITPQQPEPQPQKEIMQAKPETTTAKTRAPKVILRPVASADLMNLIRDTYAASGLTDAEFALSVRHKIHPELNSSHVMNRRLDAGIPSNTKPKPVSDTDALLAMIEALEARVAALESPKLL